MSRKPARQQVGVALFPFLAVLICTMGALIVLLVLLVQQARVDASTIAAQKVGAQAAASADSEAARQRLEDAKWQRELLEKARAEKTKELSDARARLAHLEEHMHRLEEQARALLDKAKSIDEGKKLRDDELAAARAEAEKLKEEINRKRKEIADAKRKGPGKGDSYALIPYEGPAGTRRRPIYIECTEFGVVLQPEGLIFKTDDFTGPMGPGNPLDTALRAIREYLERTANNKTGLPYPLLVVRPGGIVAYGAARLAMRSWDDEFGYELIGDDKQLDYGPADPALNDLLNKSVAVARQRQAMMAAMMPRQYQGEEPLTSFASEPPSAVSPASAAGPGGGLGNGRSGSGIGNGTGQSGTGGFPGGGYGQPGGGGYVQGRGGYAQGGGSGGTGARGGAGGGAGNGLSSTGNGPGGTGPGGTGPGGTGPGGTGPGGMSPGGNGSGVAGTGNGGPNGGSIGGPGGVAGGGTSSGGGGIPSATAALNNAPAPAARFGQNFMNGSDAIAGGGTGGQNGLGGGGGIGTGFGSGSGSGGQPGDGLAANAAGGAAGQGGSPANGAYAGGGQAGGQPGGPGGGSAGMSGSSAMSGGGAAGGGAAGGSSMGSMGSAGMSQAGGMAGPNLNFDFSKNKKQSGGGGGSGGTSRGGGRSGKGRGSNWALTNAKPHTIGVTRPMNVQIHSDRIVLMPERGDSRAAVVVPIAPELSPDDVTHIVTAVQNEIKGWGIAVADGYWKPILKAEVAPDAQRHFANLKVALDGSGIEIVRK
jgi:hypothetical protein